MAYAVRFKFPQSNGLGSVANYFAAHEGQLDGKDHFWMSKDPLRAIRFDSEANALAFIRKYQQIGEIDPAYRMHADKDKKIKIVKI